MLGTLVGIIFVSIFLWLYYKHSGEKFNLGGIGDFNSIYYCYENSDFTPYGAMHSSQEMTKMMRRKRGITTGQTYGLLISSSVIGPISGIVFRGYFKLFCLNGHLVGLPLWYPQLYSATCMDLAHSSVVAMGKDFYQLPSSESANRFSILR